MKDEYKRIMDAMLIAQEKGGSFYQGALFILKSYGYVEKRVNMYKKEVYYGKETTSN